MERATTAKCAYCGHENHAVWCVYFRLATPKRLGKCAGCGRQCKRTPGGDIACPSCEELEFME